MKKIFTFFLALVASVGISSAAITVRLDPSSCSGWSTVRLWAWTDAGDVFDSWPGQIVSKDGDGWYAYTFSSSITSVSIIWTNGTDQTVNIEGVTSSTCYALNSTTGTQITASVVNCPANVTPDPDPTPDYEQVKIGDLYYNLDAINQTAEVTYQLLRSEYNYSGLIAATIPASVTYNSVTYSVTSIGNFAFYRCSGLTSVTIPNSVTSIGEDAFTLCSSLTSVTIPNSVTSIGSAFSSCTGLTSVTIPNSVTSIGGWAFSGCSGLTSPVYNTHVFAYMPTSYSGAYTIPDGIELIAGGAFSGCTGLTSVTIPNSVTSIGNSAFYDCSSLTSVTIEAETPPTLDESAFSNTHCSIYVPCGTFESYENEESWSSYASRIKYKPYPSYTINKKAENGHITTSSTDIFTMCDTEHPVICTATPDRGCYFVRWADGNTENPRTIELSQDTTMEAIFDYLLSGKCGKDSALTWTFEPASMALNITGKGALSENYTYGTFIESLTIGNEITSIGEYAFSSCNNLKNVIIGSSVKILEQGAFAYCSSFESITCYSMRPPTVNTDALYGLDYSTIVYVPADYLNTYKMHDAWGQYDVRPLGAKGTETTNLSVTPAENTAEVAWPAISGAATYELVIKDKSGNVICTLVFNANGQLTQIAFGAPVRNNAPQQTQAAGFSFTVTGLESGTSYDLTITSKDNSGTTLDTKTISFTTSVEAPQGIDQVLSDQVQCTKVIREGQIFILRGDKTYTLQGQEVK